MRQVLLGLGSNLGDRLEFLRQAVRRIEDRVGPGRPSRVYESASFFDPAQPPYLNLCLVLDCDWTPDRLLSHLRDIERELGRPYPRLKDRSPRTIDIDILLVGDLVLETEELIVPHPGLRERDFFLVPMLELLPDLRCPKTGVEFSSYLERLPSRSVYSIGPLF